MIKISNITLLLTISFSLINSGYAAGKFYKWVDDKGQIHYSQIAPPVTEGNTDDVVKIGGNSGSIKMQPYQKGRYLYCGKLELPTAHLTDALILQNIKLGLKDWIQSQQEAEQEYNKTKTSQANKSTIKQAKDWFDETSCRVTWANKRLNYLTSNAYKKSIALDKIEKEYQNLQKARNRECPENPNYLGRGVTYAKNYPNLLVGDAAEEYYQCTERYKKQMKPLKDKLREFKRK